ncbi:hypothetical protein BDN71DRAFT_1507608 [Pleurotus eryngii]|uniref:Uncharacterized protein n=1 Tax=Pleurotus eryngii TaxID=5323 RepID=A0A9P6DFF1_PLEER|nr:hypothetical protein BDN71DRAFT_1507608 [Pleurotus eryngii]
MEMQLKHIRRIRSPPASSHFQLGFILPLVIFDCTAFTLTFLGLSRYSTPGESMLIGVAPLLPRTSISAHVLRDGLFYFLILCVVNISWAISSSFLDPDFQNIVHLPSSALTVILMNRMILHTRSYLERTQANDFRTSRTSRPVSLPEFAIGIHSPSYSHGQITISTNSTLRD